MNICTVSTRDSIGKTVSSLFLAYSLAYIQGSKVLYTYTGSTNPLAGIIKYSQASLETRNTSLIAKLIEVDSFKGSDIPDYCVKLNSNVDLLDLTSGYTNDNIRKTILNFVLDTNVYDYIIVEVDSDLESDISKMVIEKSETVMFITSPHIKDIRDNKELREKLFKDEVKDYICVVNKYKEEIYALRDISKLLAVKHRCVCKIHYTPFVIKCCNTNSLDSFFTAVVSKDPRVYELINDQKELTEAIVYRKGDRFKWGGKK